MFTLLHSRSKWKFRDASSLSMCIVLLISAALLLLSFTFTSPKKLSHFPSTSLSSRSSGRSSQNSFSSNPTSLTRKFRNLVYWAPHKTGSTSMRSWLDSISPLLSSATIHGPYFPSSPKISWHTIHNRSLSKRHTCSILVGHIHVNPVTSREDERELGAVITSFRKARDVLASKYWHRTRELIYDGRKLWRDPSSEPSRKWFFYWHVYDVCEPLRYYDGLPGCDLSNVDARIDSIVRRMDCTIDIDDAEKDLFTLCNAVGVSRQDCPNTRILNVKEKNSTYEEMFEIPHIRTAMQEAVSMTERLNEAMRRRRCRFLEDGILPEDRQLGQEKPKWPFKGCDVRPKKKN